MVRWGSVLGLFLVGLVVVFGMDEDCEECQAELCPIPHGCEAGLVKDHCGCCNVCAKTEYELCDHPEVQNPPGVHHGDCGDNLVCRLRQDVEEDEEQPDEALCFCNIEGALCGSDGVTYDNLCQLMAAGVRSENKIVVASKGPCEKAPEIVSKPEHVKEPEGSNVALICEATGYPIPAVEWTWTRVDGKTEFLPSDDLRISVNMRGGPERWQITGWLQIMDVHEEHEGDYTCIAQNKLGMAKASARVKVTEKSGDGKW